MSNQRIISAQNASGTMHFEVNLSEESGKLKVVAVGHTPDAVLKNNSFKIGIYDANKFDPGNHKAGRLAKTYFIDAVGEGYVFEDIPARGGLRVGVYYFGLVNGEKKPVFVCYSEPTVVIGMQPQQATGQIEMKVTLSEDEESGKFKVVDSSPSPDLIVQNESFKIGLYRDAGFVPGQVEDGRKEFIPFINAVGEGHVFNTNAWEGYRVGIFYSGINGPKFLCTSLATVWE